MPNDRSSRIIKDGHIVNNDWTIVVNDNTALPEGNLLVSFDLWQSHKSMLLQRPLIGLYLQNDHVIDDIADELAHFAVIAIYFPTFMDGRGFSMARLLRDRYNYQGEIRATGNIIRDQLHYLKRCGVNAFDFDETIDLHASLTSLNDFTEAYQMGVDQKTPLFRRRL